MHPRGPGSYLRHSNLTSERGAPVDEAGHPDKGIFREGRFTPTRPVAYILPAAVIGMAVPPTGCPVQ
jgi:hypothetical protein